ncbi:MAG: hypothetical protein ACRDZ3_01730, partial [Acidimicrobiia bacterium]
VVLDIDASLMEIHSENKEGTAATYKGGFGFHPMFCFADATGEASLRCCGRGTPGRTRSWIRLRSSTGPWPRKAPAASPAGPAPR